MTLLQVRAQMWIRMLIVKFLAECVPRTGLMNAVTEVIAVAVAAMDLVALQTLRMASNIANGPYGGKPLRITSNLQILLRKRKKRCEWSQIFKFCSESKKTHNSCGFYRFCCRIVIFLKIVNKVENEARGKHGEGTGKHGEPEMKHGEGTGKHGEPQNEARGEHGESTGKHGDSFFECFFANYANFSHFLFILLNFT